MARQKKKVGQKKNAPLQTALHIFEESCRLLRENWRFCFNISLLLVSALILGAAILFIAYRLHYPWWLILILFFCLAQLWSVLLVGRNKNFNSLKKDLITERYPLWSNLYFLAALKILLTNFVLILPLMIAILGAIFFGLVFPSLFWLLVTVIIFGGLWLWLKKHFLLGDIILSLKKNVSLSKSWQQSWQLAFDQGWILLALFLLDVCFFLPAFIFLPFISWMFIAILLSLQKSLIYQYLIEKKSV